MIGGGLLVLERCSISAARADEIEAFVKARLPEGALVNARRTADEIRTRAKLKARLLPLLESALR